MRALVILATQQVAEYWLPAGHSRAHRRRRSKHAASRSCVAQYQADCRRVQEREEGRLFGSEGTQYALSTILSVQDTAAGAAGARQGTTDATGAEQNTGKVG